MPRGIPAIAALGLLLGAQAAWPQAADTPPPAAGAPRDGGPYRPLPPDLEPSYRGQPGPPAAPPGPRGDPRRADGAPPVPPSPGARELQARAEARDLRWRTAVEAEFGAWWSRLGCFPHPRRHDRWFDALAEHLGADTPREEHVLYGLVMERVEAHAPPPWPWFGGLSGDAEERADGAAVWRAPDDLFCR